MEPNPQCQNHNRPLQMYCPICKEVLCTECIRIHKEKDCVGIDFLPFYSRDNILPKYKERIEEFETKKYEIEKAINNFTASLANIRGDLIKLRGKLEDTIQNINKTLN